jgi:hypothetical protein
VATGFSSSMKNQPPRKFEQLSHPLPKSGMCGVSPHSPYIFMVLSSGMRLPILEAVVYFYLILSVCILLRVRDQVMGVLSVYATCSSIIKLTYNSDVA